MIQWGPENAVIFHFAHIDNLIGIAANGLQADQVLAAGEPWLLRLVLRSR